MRKGVCLWLVMLLLAGLLAACGASPSTVTPSTGQTNTLDPGATTADGAEIAVLLTEEQKNGDAQGQAVWATVSRFAGEENVSCAAYIVDHEDADDLLAKIELAAKGAARLVVALGQEVGILAAEAATAYADIEFLLLDTELEEGGDNVLTVRADQLQVGWLAGYAAAQQGHRRLAVVTEAGEAAAQREFGFLAGVAAACERAEVPAGEIGITSFWIEDGYTDAAYREALAALLGEAETDLVFDAREEGLAQTVRAALSTNTSVAAVKDGDGAEADVDVIWQPALPLQKLLGMWQKGILTTGKALSWGLPEGALAYDLEKTDLSERAVEELRTEMIEGGLLAELGDAWKAYSGETDEVAAGAWYGFSWREVDHYASGERAEVGSLQRPAWRAQENEELAALPLP